MEKKCSKCQIIKNVSEFGKASRYPSGLRYDCKECVRSDCRKYWLINKERELLRNKKYRAANPEKIRASLSRQYKNKPKYFQAYSKDRRHKQRNSTLHNVFIKETVEIYKNRPIGYHVDHIIPINGKNVSGLHVPWNLQYLTVEDNLKKGNRF